MFSLTIYLMANNIMYMTPNLNNQPIARLSISTHDFESKITIASSSLVFSYKIILLQTES